MIVAPRALRPLLTALCALLAVGLPFLAHSLRKSRVFEEDDLSQVTLRGHELDESTRLAHQREQERHRLVVEVSQGRMPLLEAAIRWMGLHRQAPIDMEKFREAHSGASDEERHCRGMITMVTDLLGDEDPCRAQAVGASLERELDGLLRRGPLRLGDHAHEAVE